MGANTLRDSKKIGIFMKKVQAVVPEEIIKGCQPTLDKFECACRNFEVTKGDRLRQGTDTFQRE